MDGWNPLPGIRHRLPASAPPRSQMERGPRVTEKPPILCADEPLTVGVCGPNSEPQLWGGCSVGGQVPPTAQRTVISSQEGGPGSPCCPDPTNTGHCDFLRGCRSCRDGHSQARGGRNRPPEDPAGFSARSHGLSAESPAWQASPWLRPRRVYILTKIESAP